MNILEEYKNGKRLEFVGYPIKDMRLNPEPTGIQDTVALKVKIGTKLVDVGCDVRGQCYRLNEYDQPELFQAVRPIGHHHYRV